MTARPRSPEIHFGWSLHVQRRSSGRSGQVSLSGVARGALGAGEADERGAPHTDPTELGGGTPRVVLKQPALSPTSTSPTSSL